MHGVVRFWLDRGVDGFRIDVVQCMGKPPDLPDDPPEVVGHPPFRAQRLRRDAPDPARPAPAVRLVPRRPDDGGRGLPALHRTWSPRTTARATSCTSPSTSRRSTRRGTPAPGACGSSGSIEELDPIAAWPTWVLSNHDNRRHRTRYGGSRRGRARPPCCCSRLRGTPFLYQGEELGLEDAVCRPNAASIPAAGTAAGRRSRGPAPPTTAGVSTTRGCRGRPTPDARNVRRPARRRRVDPASLPPPAARPARAARRCAPVRFRLLPRPPARSCGNATADDDRRLVAVNFTDAAVDIAPPVTGSWRWRATAAAKASRHGPARPTGPCSCARGLRRRVSAGLAPPWVIGLEAALGVVPCSRSPAPVRPRSRRSTARSGCTLADGTSSC